MLNSVYLFYSDTIYSFIMNVQIWPSFLSAALQWYDL